MVEFYDPIEKKDIHFYVEKEIRKRWDKLRNNELVKKDEDRVYIVDGRERTGKSVFTLQQAKYLNPNFNINHVCYTPDEFLNAIRTSPKGSVIVFDEAFRGLSSRGALSKVNKKIVQAMMEMGQRNLIVFIVLPTFFLLEMYPAVLRSNCLFHIYKDKKGTRRFRIYNYQQKSLLYNYGKKKGFSYRFPKVNIRGRFYNIYAINEQTYRDKKFKSLQDMNVAAEEPEENNKYLTQRNFLLKKYQETGKTYIEIEKQLKECEFPISKTHIGRIIQGKLDKKGKVPLSPV